MRLRSKLKSRLHRQRQARRPICRRFMLRCHLPCVRRYAESDSGSDIQRDSLLDGDGQPSVIGAAWEAEDIPDQAAFTFWQNPDAGTPPNESNDDPDPMIHHGSWDSNPLLMVEEVTSPSAHHADIIGAAAACSSQSCESAGSGIRGADEEMSELSDTSSTQQLSDVRFTFNSRFHMDSSHQYRVWKDLYGQHRPQAMPVRNGSSESLTEEGENVTAPELEQAGEGAARMVTESSNIESSNTESSNISAPTDEAQEEENQNYRAAAAAAAEGGGFDLYRGALSLPTYPQFCHSSPPPDDSLLPTPTRVLTDHRQSFEQNWSNLRALGQEDIFAVCTNPALSPRGGSNENTLSSRGSLGGIRTRSSSLTELDHLLDDFSIGTGSARSSYGRQNGQAAAIVTTRRDTFGRLFAVSNRLTGFNHRPTMAILQPPMVEPMIREPVHLTSLFIDPNHSEEQGSSSSCAGTGSNTGSGSGSGSASNTGSIQSGGSGRRPVQQNWYVYDPRLLPGGARREENRVTVETNYRGVQQCWSTPGIISPPSYEEIASSPATGLPPPYPDSSVGTLSSLGPPSESGCPLPEPSDPPPPYEPHSTELDDITDGLEIQQTEVHTHAHEQQDTLDDFSDDIQSGFDDVDDVDYVRDVDDIDDIDDDSDVAPAEAHSTESEAAINEELDSILEEEGASNPDGSIGDIGELSHGFFMNSDAGNARISSFGGAIMTGIGFGAARPPVRWNRGMGLDRWANTSNWVSS